MNRTNSITTFSYYFVKTICDSACVVLWYIYIKFSVINNPFTRDTKRDKLQTTDKYFRDKIPKILTIK